MNLAVNARPGRPDTRTWVLIAIALLLSLASLAPVVSGGISHFDEGFIVSGAAAILRGQIPVRDFYTGYGPAQFYLTAGVFALFGENLLVSRTLHLVTLALICAMVSVLGLRLSGGRVRWAAMTAIAFMMATGTVPPNSGYPAVTAVLPLLGACMMLGAWFTSGARWHLVAGSLMVGLAGLLRWDFALFGFVASGATLLLASGGKASGRTVSALSCALVPGSALLLLAFGPLIVLGGVSQWFKEVPLFLLTEFRHWRNLDFMGPTLQALLRSLVAADAYTASHAASQLVLITWSVAGAVCAMALAGWRMRRPGARPGSDDVLAFSLGMVVLLLCNQLRVRAGFPQGYPAMAASLPLLPYLWTGLSSAAWRVRAGRWIQAAPALLAIVTTATLAYAWQADFRAALQRQPLSTPMERGGAVRISDSSRQVMADYARLIAHLRHHTQPGEALFSGVQDASRLHSNDAMLYFLADRPSATRFIEMEPGLNNTQDGQEKLVRELQSSQVRTLVLIDKPSREPNATSRSNGVHVLDVHVQANFEEVARFGSYQVLTRIAPGR